MDRKPLASENVNLFKSKDQSDKLLSVPDVASWILRVNSALSLIDIKKTHELNLYDLFLKTT